jgi:hypothetical protein
MEVARPVPVPTLPVGVAGSTTMYVPLDDLTKYVNDLESRSRFIPTVALSGSKPRPGGRGVEVKASYPITDASCIHGLRTEYGTDLEVTLRRNEISDRTRDALHPSRNAVKCKLHPVER